MSLFGSTGENSMGRVCKLEARYRNMLTAHLHLGYVLGRPINTKLAGCHWKPCQENFFYFSLLYNNLYKNLETTRTN
jgi:hypothetical protein